MITDNPLTVKVHADNEAQASNLTHKINSRMKSINSCFSHNWLWQLVLNSVPSLAHSYVYTYKGAYVSVIVLHCFNYLGTIKII